MAHSVGHALNKMLKDTILRSVVERGHRVEMRPGWDCHGLPIEQKALIQAQLESHSPLQLRAICRRFAEGAIAKQSADMRKWGLLADYDNPVLTMDPKYEADQLRIFARFVERGLVFSDKRPVYWSPTSR